MCGSQVEAHEFSDCRSVVGKELVSAAISAAELNSGGEARPAVLGPRPALESAREHPTSSAAAAGSAEVIQLCVGPSPVCRDAQRVRPHRWVHSPSKEERPATRACCVAVCGRLGSCGAG